VTKTTLEWLAELPPLGPPEYEPYWDEVDRGPFAVLFDRAGEPVSMRTWARLDAHTPYVRIAEDTVGPYWVSTVWIGIDHSFGFGPPLIFETMVFRGDETDLDCWRYSTETEALAGHARMVDEVRLIDAAER
jgi:hypothetical protein